MLRVMTLDYIQRRCYVHCMLKPMPWRMNSGVNYMDTMSTVVANSNIEKNMAAMADTLGALHWQHFRKWSAGRPGRAGFSALLAGIYRYVNSAAENYAIPQFCVAISGFLCLFMIKLVIKTPVSNINGKELANVRNVAGW